MQSSKLTASPKHLVLALRVLLGRLSLLHLFEQLRLFSFPFLLGLSLLFTPLGVHLSLLFQLFKALFVLFTLLLLILS